MEKKKDLYADYKSGRYAHYRNVATGDFEKQKVKSAKAGERLKPIMKKVKVSFGEVKELKLDKFGTVAPTLDTEDFTIVSNYLVDFWGAVMGDSPVSVYLHLKRHAYGKKDYCYVDIDLICLKMGKGRTAVNGYLKTLEEYGFIAMFLRKDMEDNNRDVSPLFKIRRYVPLLTEEMYQQNLHPKLQKLHDDFMEEYEDITFNTQVYKTDDVIEGIVDEGEVINNKEVKEKIETAVREGQLEEYVINKLNPTQRNLNEDFHIYMEKIISKPSYDTWIKKSVLIQIDEFNYILLAPNGFAKDWLEQRYIAMTKQFVSELIIGGEQLSTISFELMNEYIERNIGRAI